MVRLVGFGFDSSWRKSFKPITKRSNPNHVITFDSHLKTAQTDKSNYVIAVAKLSDRLKNVAPFLLTKEKENQKQSHLVRAIISAY